MYARHYRYTYATLVLGYLLYSFLATSMSLPKSFYQLLDIRPDTVDNNGLKGETYFIQVQGAFEALKDPVVRFAYDRY